MIPKNSLQFPLSTIPLLFIMIIIIYGCQTTGDHTYEFHQGDLKENKHKGAHVFGYLDSLNIQSIKKFNTNWITLVPFSSQKDYDSPKVKYFRGDSSEIARKEALWSGEIQIAHQAGMKVFLKPHLWLHQPTDGKWRSDVFPKDDEAWEQWQKSYIEYILMYARLAEKNNVELFCLGTEFTKLTKEKTAFWHEVIKKVKKVYSGKITYAANWYQEYEQITFWDQLDYIGVQAYFPLVNKTNPTTEEISKGWPKYLNPLASISKKYNRKILFTEMGYKSTDDSAKEPWNWIDYSESADQIQSNETQANCYQAFFDTVWDKEWFAGVHIWQMRSDHEEHKRGKTHLDFTPQGKPAATIITNSFK